MKMNKLVYMFTIIWLVLQFGNHPQSTSNIVQANDNGIRITSNDTVNGSVIAKAVKSMMLRKTASSNSVAMSAITTCLPISYSLLQRTFEQYGSPNPNYVASTREEAALFPNLLWDGSKREAYMKIVKQLKEKILHWAGKRIQLILLFKKLLLTRLHLPLRRITQRLAMLKNLAKRHVKRSSSITRNNDCFTAGTVDQLTKTTRLCTTCMATTTLPGDRFPRYLNEVLCQAGSGCFQGEGICQQKYFTMKILKKTGNCVPLTQNGQKVYIEEWMPTWQNIRICCECQLRSNSWMTNLI
eukprot:Seg7397.2 transcript_id=Seg7397.2/GoldUCD/mRNA.D3Y31 product="putative skeletal organic matrix protein 8" pseudo=true protein_id=Seg7397.2/GoldUCD/D3Y31